MKSLFRIEQEGFPSSEKAETRYFDSARLFYLFVSFQNKNSSETAVNSVKYFDFDGSVCAGLNVFLAISM